MSATAVRSEYAASAFEHTAIRSFAAKRKTTVISPRLEELDSKGNRMTAAERRLAELLTLLIEDFEEKHYALKASSPVDVLNELMSANNLKQKDLVDIFGTPSIVSEVLHGKRQFTTEHIRRLSRRFQVSPEVFI